MHQQVIIAFGLYFCILIAIGLFASHKQRGASDFLLGGRGLNYWVTAISANASDMSSWLFMGFPMVVYLHGGVQIWTAVGLIAFMFLNWQIVAPRLRVETERFNTLTLSSYLESRFEDQTGALRLLGASLSLLFLTTYVASGVVGLGYLFESIFGFNYYLGCLIGIVSVLIYASIGGFVAVAWTDFFQGMFLLVVVLMVPVLAIGHMGSFDPIWEYAELGHISLSLLGDGRHSVWMILNLVFGWGLGYFGQPHILNKFMAIRDPKEIHKSKWISFVWQVLALSAAGMVGVVGIGFFQGHLGNPELVFVEMVKVLFHPLLAGLILCAFLAATLSTMDSQILVLSSIISEDLFKKTFHKQASDSQIVLVSRLSIVLVSALAFVIAAFKTTTIFSLVNYCWVGLGCSFGPVLIASLYSKRITREGAIAGMCVGGGIGALWVFLGWPISAMIPGFIASGVAMWWVSIYRKASKI